MSTLTSMALVSLTGTPGTYLGVVNDGTKKQDFMKFRTEDVLSKNAKFAVEHVYADVVHIRSCFNNKYWVRSSETGNWIVAKGDHPDVDKESWTCTLFRLDMGESGTEYAKFYHLQSGLRVRVTHDVYLTIDPTVGTDAICQTVDYDAFVILPKVVAFRGSNGLFYKNSEGKDDDVDARFSVSGLADPDIRCEIQYTFGGDIRVKALGVKPMTAKAKKNVPVTDLERAAKAKTSKDESYSNHEDDMFWTYLGSDQEDLIGLRIYDPEDYNQIFRPIRIKNNMIGIRCCQNGKICKRADVQNSLYKTDRLVANARGLEADAYLEVCETAICRSVKTYDFDLDKRRIYDVGLLYSNEHVWDNYTDVAESGTANGTIKTKKIHTYNNNVNISGTVSTTVSTGIPFIVEGEISVSATAGYTHDWGTSEEEEQEIGDVFTVVVQPMKRTIAKGVATRGTCDVPFSYVQKDYPMSGGPPIITKLSDGVFTTTNAYSFKDEVRYEDLPPHVGPADEAPEMCLQRPVKKNIF